jgi:hypothetical protein
MIKKFNDFIVEKMGYPDAIRPITDLIKKECQKRLDKWLSSKGEFEDYQELIEIPYEVIRKNVNVLSTEFKDYPVEFITIDFSINNIEMYDKKTRYSGFSRHITKNSTTSTWIYSETPNISKAYKIHIEIMYDISKDSKSVEIEIMKNQVDSIIDHEVLHTYEDIHNKKFKKNLQAYSTAYELVGIHPTTEIEDLFWLIYSTSDIELRARVAEFNPKIPMSKMSHDILYYLEKLDVDRIIGNTKNELIDNNNFTQKEFNEYYNDFGNKVYKLYKTVSREINMKLPSYMVKFKNKDMKYVVEYFVKDIKKRGEYLKRKWHKRMSI